MKRWKDTTAFFVVSAAAAIVVSAAVMASAVADSTEEKKVVTPDITKVGDGTPAPSKAKSRYDADGIGAAPNSFSIDQRERVIAEMTAAAVETKSK